MVGYPKDLKKTIVMHSGPYIYVKWDCGLNNSETDSSK